MGLFAYELINVGICITDVTGTEAGGEITVSSLKLHGGNRAWAVKRVQTRAGRLRGGIPSLAVGVGEKLLLVGIHLALNFGVLPGVGTRREGSLGGIGASSRGGCSA